MEKKNQGIQSVEQAFEIIEFFSDKKNPVSLSEAADEMSLSKSKLHKYLASLLRIGIVTQAPNGHYCHGAKLIELGAKILGHTDILQFCEPELQQLRLETQEATALSVWTTNGPMIVRFLENPYPVAFSFRVGFYAPLTKSSVGRCFAAFLPEQAYTHLVDDEISRQPTQYNNFMNDLESIRNDGYAIRYKSTPTIPGAKAISAPIFDAMGNIVACIIIIGFEQREIIPEKDIKLIINTSKKISQYLGYVVNCK
ncbi:IclR family transcriptional regulator [Vibrio parahaemolyticus]|nr:IclR family transcriptional regulator [Vibrio parahaemolyticus]EIT7132143.1 IclR family transcriptional regulator [Vibrio parahaemolyticus]EIZ1368961.1 IclR family transcriptional regulator [Vibrio parahaemolyticus]EIZ4252540.1 IclR family transcriptional regulator [Vibrio parahaemolyticus]